MLETAGFGDVEMVSSTATDSSDDDRRDLPREKALEVPV
jgi:hypothetical protein